MIKGSEIANNKSQTKNIKSQFDISYLRFDICDLGQRASALNKLSAERSEGFRFTVKSFEHRYEFGYRKQVLDAFG